MRIVKKVGIALLGFVIVMILCVSVALWYLFTPEKLSPIVNKQAKEYLACHTTIKKVEPTFFSSYPFFGIELTNLCLQENNSKKDTILYTPQCFASVNVISYLFGGDIKLDPFLVENAYLNFKINASGQSNFDILESSSHSTEDDSKESSLGDMDISNVEFKNCNANYTDESTFRKAKISNLNAKLELTYNSTNQFCDLEMQVKQLLFVTSDSLALHFDAGNCDLKIKSKATNKDLFKSDVQLVCQSMSLSMAGDTLLSQMKIDTHLPFTARLSENSYAFEESKLTVNNEQAISFNGLVDILKDNSISSDINYSSNEWDVEKIMALIPNAYSEPLKEVKAKGFAQVSGSVKGLLSESSTPLLVANVDYARGELKYSSYPTVKDIQLSMSTQVDLNKTQNSTLTIHPSSAKIDQSKLSIKGEISNLLESPSYDIYSGGDFNLADFKPFIPKDQNINIKGSLTGDLHTRFTQSDLDRAAYHRIYVSGDFKTKDFYAVYQDSMKVELASANLKLNLPSQARADQKLTFASIKIDAPNLKMDVSPEIHAATENLELSVDINQVGKDLSVPISSCQLKFASLTATVDTLSLRAKNAEGQFAYAPNLDAKQKVALINSSISSQEILIASRDTTLFDAKELYTKTNLKYDSSQNNVILKWQPEVAIRFSDAIYDLGNQLKGQIPNISFTLDSDTMAIAKADVILGDSDFSLKGELTDISSYLKDEALLKGKFDLISKNTDVYQLMDIFNGMGSQDSTLTSNEPTASTNDPFMVPKGVEIRLNTSIDQTIVNDNIIENIKGGLTVKDGTLILDQMGFTSKAANMQLTAMYRSDRKNHLFSSVDFHLLDIDIAELIDLIPSVDTIIPMLKSFEGKGEFHLAGETYLKSDYSLKQSTIRGAASFQGQELTLMDTQTFDMIASKLMFKKKTENVIDSLSVEMTLFRDEIDLYPFLLVMDNYKAVISGRHNTDNRFNYHISVTDTPLPVRLGLNVTGTIEDLKYKLAPCKYKHLYDPKKQGVLEAQTLRLKKLISESLKENVKAIE